MNDLNKIILKLLHIVKINKLEKVNKTSLVKYLYFLDYFYAKKHKEQFSNIDWKMNYYGPHSFQIDNCLDELTKSKRVNFYFGNNNQHIYYLSDAMDFNNFEINGIKDIEGDWESLIKEYQVKQDLKSLLNKTYSTEPIEGKSVGDIINFEKIDFIIFKEDIKQIKINITDMKTIKRIEELRKKIKSKPLEIPNFSFMNSNFQEECTIQEPFSNGFPDISNLHISINDKE